MEQFRVARTEFASIHDCFATSILEEKSTITFIFSDGFWVNAYDDLDNHLGTFTSLEGSLTIHESSVQSIELHDNIHLTVSWGILKRKVNSKEWVLEFLSENAQDGVVTYLCSLWYEKSKADFLTIELTYLKIEKNYSSIDTSRKW